MFVIPLSGNVDKTLFKLSTYIPPEISVNTNRKYYFRIKDKTELLNIGNVKFEENSALAEFTFSSEFMKSNKLDLNGYPLIIEFIFGLTDASGVESLFINTVNLFAAEAFVNKTLAIEQATASLSNNTSEMTTEELISTTNLINNLGLTDAEVTSSNNSFNININKTDFGTKLALNQDGTLNVLKKAQCNDLYCSNQGKCSYEHEFQVLPLCACNASYSGTFCEFKKENQNLLKNYTLNIMLALANKLFNETQASSSGTTVPNSANSNINNVLVTQSILNAIKSQLEIGVKVVDNIKDMEVFTNIVSNVLDSKSETTVQNIVNSSSSVVSMIQSFFSFSNTQVIKAKASISKKNSASTANANKRLIPLYHQSLDINNYNFANKKNYNHTSNDSTNDKKLFRNLQLGSISEAISSDNISPSSAASNSIAASSASNSSFSTSSSEAEEIYNKNKDLILSNEKAKALIFKLVKSYINYFNIIYAKDMQINSTFAESSEYLKSLNISQFSLEQSNSDFDLLFSPILDIQSFDFNAFFSKRINNKLSYIDPQTCISKHLLSVPFLISEKTSYKIINNVVFALYISFKNPMYTIDNGLIEKSVSLSHYLAVFDINGNELALKDCPSEILHYLVLFPRNNTFIQSFNVNPSKYAVDPRSNVNSISQKYSASYMPVYIFPNGTIDKQNNLTTQLEKYYLTYKFQMTEYNVKNLTLPNHTLNMVKVFDQLDSRNQIKSINNGYILASTRNLGEFAVMAVYDPPSEPDDKYYFLNNPKIFLLSENWRSNSCFYFLAILCGINYLFIVVLFILNCYNPSPTKDDSDTPFALHLLKQEFETYEKDNNRFDSVFPRYNFYKYLRFYRNSGKKPSIAITIDAEAAQKIYVETQNEGNKANKGLEPSKGINMALGTDNHTVNPVDTKSNYITTQRTMLPQMEENKQINTSSNFNLFFFIFARNIYAAPWALNSPFSPKWKIMAKVFCLLYMLIFFSSLLYILNSIKVYDQAEIEYHSFAFVVIMATLASNAIFILINLLYSVNINDKTILEAIRNNLSQSSM